jgi:hypothetical protein
MLKNILSISGRSGLYKLVSQAKNMTIVEALTAEKKRLPIYSKEKTVVLRDISMYTYNDDVPLYTVLNSIKEKENGGKASIDQAVATGDELRTYLEGVLPEYDRGRVYINDIRKLILWYNILIEAGFTDFSPKEEEKETEEPESEPENKTEE